MIVSTPGGEAPQYGTRRYYQAFLSYKHETSRVFAQRLESALMAYAKPLFRAPIRVFRDERHMRPGLSLSRLIRDALRDSEFLILLASPEAARSPWVDDELEIWCGELQRTSNLILCLTAGDIVPSPDRSSLDWAATTALPGSLRRHLPAVPFFIDMRWAAEADLTLLHPRFKQEINRITAHFRNVDPNEMAGEEVRVYRRNKLIRNATTAVFAGLVLALTVGAMSLYATNQALTVAKAEADTSAQEARRQTAVAEQRLADAYTERARIDVDEHPDRALAAIGAAYQHAATPSGAMRYILTDAAAPLIGLRRRFGFGEQIPLQLYRGPEIGVSPDGERLLVWSGVLAGYVDVEGAELHTLKAESAVLRVEALAQDRLFIATQDEIFIHDIARGAVEFSLPVAADAVHVTPDGERVVIEAGEGTDLELWDLAAGRRLVRIARTSYEPPAFHDGRSMLLETSPGQLEVRRLDTGALVRTVAEHPDGATHLAFAPRGEIAVTAGKDGVVTWWTASGSRIQASPWQMEGGDICADGRVVSFDTTERVLIWSAWTGEGIVTLTGHNDAITTARWSPDCSLVVTAGRDRTVRVWSPVTGETLAVFSGHRNRVDDVRWTPDGQTLVTSSGDATVSTWDVGLGRRLAGPSHPGSSAVAFSADGGVAATADGYGGIGLWSTASWQRLDRLEAVQVAEDVPYVHELAFSAGAGHVLAHGSRLRVWDLQSRSLRVDADGGASAGFVEGSPLVCLHRSGPGDDAPFNLYCWDLTTGASVTPHEDVVDWERCVVKRTATGLRVIDMVTDRTVADVEASSEVHSAAVDRQCRRLVVGETDGENYLWDLEQRRKLSDLGSEGFLSHAVFDAAGGRVAVTRSSKPRVLEATLPQGLELYDAGTGVLISRIHGYDSGVTRILFLGGGSRLLTSAFERTVKLWDVDTGDLLATLGPVRQTERLSAGPLGDVIVTADNLGKHVWDGRTGEPLGNLSPTSSGLGDTLLLGPDETKLLTVDPEGVTLWSLANGDPSREDVAELLACRSPFVYDEKGQLVESRRSTCPPRQAPDLAYRGVRAESNLRASALAEAARGRPAAAEALLRRHLAITEKDPGETPALATRLLLAALTDEVDPVQRRSMLAAQTERTTIAFEVLLATTSALLEDLDRPETALAVLDHLLATFPERSDEVKPNRIETLFTLGRQGELLAACDDSSGADRRWDDSLWIAAFKWLALESVRSQEATKASVALIGAYERMPVGETGGYRYIATRRALTARGAEPRLARVTELLEQPRGPGSLDALRGLLKSRRL